MHTKEPKKDGLFLPSRQVGMLFAGLSTVLFGVFMSGYFLGKKQVMDELVYKIEQESFADQLYSSLCLLYDQDVDDVPEPVTEVTQNDQLSEQENTESLALEPDDMTTVASVDAIELDTVVSEPTNQKKYYAQLIGFGTLPAAQQFAKRVGRCISVDIRDRQSTTAKGRQITWYQVVTKPFSDRAILEETVDRISKQEKLKGVQISTC